VGGTLPTDITTLSFDTVISPGAEYSLCVNGSGCATDADGLKVVIDIEDFYVDFILSGTTGPVADGDNFNLELSFPGYAPSTIDDVTPSGFLLTSGLLTFSAFGGMNSLVFEGAENDDGSIAADSTYRFSLTVTDVTAAPAPGAFSLLGLALAGMGFVRRREKR